MRARTLIVIVTCLMVLASPARQASTSNAYPVLRGRGARSRSIAHRPQQAVRSSGPSANLLLEKFWTRMAEVAVLREMGDDHDLRSAIALLQKNTQRMQRLRFTNEAA